ncbi:hypothetical protein PR048_007389 [Dryococelus australis]|uniref:Uncharacterized protein n=1 Tax=Dryococelus australis TaxID=614101 RepID=A0ABQ9HV15_9NEOP|nr:hypothetical protein PR048_007389 [Dryococelus australis]
MNMGIKRNAEDMLRRLKPVAIALDTVQNDSYTISNVVDVWKSLRRSLEDENLDEDSMKKFDSRYHQALGEGHFLAYLMDPRFCDQHLTTDKKSEAHSLANNKYNTHQLNPDAEVFSPAVFTPQIEAAENNVPRYVPPQHCQMPWYSCLGDPHQHRGRYKEMSWRPSPS